MEGRAGDRAASYAWRKPTVGLRSSFITLLIFLLFIFLQMLIMFGSYMKILLHFQAHLRLQTVTDVPFGVTLIKYILLSFKQIRFTFSCISRIFILLG